MSESKKVSGLNRARIPLHKQNVFVAEKREGYTRMWINEAPGEIEKYELAGWNVVLEKDFKSHNNQVQLENQLDSVVRRVVNKDPNAPWKTAVLMEIPTEYYEEDQKAEQAAIDEQEKSYDPAGLIKNSYGRVTIQHTGRG